MKQTTKLKTGLFMLLCIIGVVWSCKKESVDITASRNEFVLDSLRLADSIAAANAALTRSQFEADRAYTRAMDSLDAVNQAGGVTYAISIVDGSASSFANGRTEATETLVTGAVVTVSQFGKTETQTTTANGMVVFAGFFRNGLNVTITKTGFTSANYIVGVAAVNNTPNGTQHYVGNIIPLFPTSGANTATISGKTTIQTDLTNKTRELAADGTTLSVGIDANSVAFRDTYLFWSKSRLAANLAAVGEVVSAVNGVSNFDANTYFVGQVQQANYETGIVGSVTSGLYSVTVPAAFDGLPLKIDYSQVAADQKLFETSGVIPGDRTATYRTLFGPGIGTSAVPAANGVTIAFDAGSGAAATAIISETNGSITGIDITAGGSGYAVAPEVVIAPPTNIGTTATATATLTNGVVTGLTIVSAGSGYTTAPGVTFKNGGGASATAALLNNGTVTGVIINNTGSGYASAPTVTFGAPGGTGTTATGTATIDAQGRLTGIAITSAGSGYAAAPVVGLAGGTPVVPANVSALWSGKSVGDVTLTSGGADYLSAPTVKFSAPDQVGTTATGVAIYDAATRSVTGIQVTSGGSGYTSVPTITITAAGSGATAKTFLSGGTVISANITANGTTAYVAPPIVTFTGGGGSGAAGTAVLSNGKVVAITITSAGSGYTSAPTITFTAGDGASAYATVANGVITGITVSDGGRNWVGAPRVTITSTEGGGATATATVSGGSVTGVTLSAGGTGYTEGNVPGSAEAFSGATTSTSKPGLKYVIDVHYGTGLRQPN